MKNILANSMAMILLVVSFGTKTALPVSAETSGDYEYELLEDGTAEITGYSGESKDVEIPSEIDGKTVTSIGGGCVSIQRTYLCDNTKFYNPYWVDCIY